MFDEIFTYSQSISSSCRNSLVSGRKGKRGRRAHTELSYFVSFFPSDNILCSFFFCFCSPAKVSCPRHSCACLCFFPGKHRRHSWWEAESHRAACSVDTLCVWTGSGPPCGNKVGRTLYVDIRCKKCPLKQVGLPLESQSEKCYSCSLSALFYFLLRQHETILDLLVETVRQIKGFNFGVVMLLTDSSTSWHRSSNKHCQISSLHCVDYVPFKTPVALQHATFWRTHRAAEFVFHSEQNLSGPVWTKKGWRAGSDRLHQLMWCFQVLLEKTYNLKISNKWYVLLTFHLK